MDNLFKSTVIKNTPLNHKFHRVHLKLEGPSFTFKTGQFVALKVGENIFRSYSLHSTPDNLPLWEMFIDITPGGPGTTYLKNLKPGDIIKTTKPAGIFTLEKDANNFIFGATGCGIAPIKPMIEELVTNDQNSQVFLFWGLRYQEDIVLEKEWEVLQNKYPNFHLFISLSKPEDNWSGRTGHITGHILELAKDLPQGKISIYLCGNTGLIVDTREALKKINFPAEKINFEKYF